MDPIITSVVATAVGAFFLWLGKTVNSTSQAVTKMSVTLHGEKGDNGIASEVRGHRKRLHRLGEVANHCVNGIYRLEEAVELDHLPVPRESGE